MRDTGTRDSILVEIDFGVAPVSNLTTVVNDIRVTGLSSVVMIQSGDAPTGKSSDENEMDAFSCRCLSSSGNFTAYISSLFGPVLGKFKFVYVIR